MCQSRSLITAASALGLIQSLIWISLGIGGALVYLSVIPVDEYKGPEDFFRVTLVKLYLEGRNSKLNGSYLGIFDADHKDPNKISLITSDLIFAFMISYVIVSVFHLYLSWILMTNRKAKNKPEFGHLLSIVKCWSCVTLVLTAIDTGLLAAFVHDIFSLTDYTNKHTSESLPTQFNTVIYIPLVLSAVALRLGLLWIWNLLVGIMLFLNAVCFGKIIGVYLKPEETSAPVETTNPKSELKPSPLLPIHYPDWARHRYSLEAVTKFDNSPEKSYHYLEDPYRNYPMHQGHQKYPASPKSRKQADAWEMQNEGFVDDEPEVLTEVEKHSDFEHSMKNFEQGRQKSNPSKPPLGKPSGSSTASASGRHV